VTTLIKQFFQLIVTSSVLVQNIFLITPFWNTCSLCSSVNTEGQVSHPYAISGVIIDLLSKGHSNIVFKTATCWQKTKFYVKQINQFKLQFNIRSVFCI
jgi:hypothetical protein